MIFIILIGFSSISLVYAQEYSQFQVQNSTDPSPEPKIRSTQNIIEVEDNINSDCTPASDETPAIVEGNYLVLKEGHHYCRLGDGFTSCYVWDGTSFTSSMPSYDVCARFSGTWCHGFEDREDYPCTSLSLSYQGELVCIGERSVSVSARIPCMIVQRWPYPRGLVNLENDFTVLGPWVSERGSSFTAEWEPGRMRNYLLEVEWRFNEGSVPVWFFDEREWNAEPDYASGFTVTHTYQTSSWEKPENGPSLEGRLNLPAYQAQVYVQWIPYVHRRFEYADQEEKVFHCGVSERACLEQKIQCEATGYESGDPGCHVTVWRSYDSGWVPIDLRDYGNGFAWYTSGVAIDISQPPADIPPVPDGARECGAIPVPVIEVQVYLNAP